MAAISAPVLARAGTPAADADPAGLVVSRGFAFGGFWLRFLAAIIDGVIVGAALGLLFLPLLFLTGFIHSLEAFVRSTGTGRPDPAIILGFFSMILVFSGLAIIVRWLYFAYLESGEKQATWGKQVLGLYVTDLTGNPIGFGRAS
ncbi:MAG TPA: RDD family protein, partial [Candidatus Acidoferrum sp.]|nr:RDD family protein [Candidatus Acidoferrum sp.]